MRVLMVLPRLGKGGAEKLTCDIVIEMQQRPGIQAKIVSFDVQNAFPELTQQLDARCIPSKVHLSPIRKNLYQLDDYLRFLNEYKPDVIHSHLFETEIISRSAYYPTAKYFTHCHDNMRQFASLSLSTFLNKQRLLEYYEREYLLNRYGKNGGNHFICISKYNYDYFNRVLPSSLRNTTLLNNAISFKKYNVVNHPRSTDEIRLVNTGGFFPIKNHVFLIEVLNCLEQMGKRATLTLLGDGPEMENIRNRARQYGVEDRVIFAGAVPNVEEYLRDGNLYIHACRNEGFGLVMLEAMAAGLPVVALDAKGNRDIIRDGENGFLIKEQNAALFAGKVVEVMTNASLYQQMSKQAVEFARGFDIKNYVDRLLALYTEALNK